jgi:hypothetical protein
MAESKPKPLNKSEQDAVDWFLKQKLSFKNGDEYTVMKWCGGDPEQLKEMRVTVMAKFMARYAEECIDKLTK